MENSNDLGFYPDKTALDHDTDVYLREVLVRLKGSGVTPQVVIESMRRVLTNFPA